MLSNKQKAAALNYAMRYDVVGCECPEFKRFNRFLSRNPKLKGDLLNFYRNLSPMTQKVYLALTWDCDRDLKDMQQDNPVKEFIEWVIVAGLFLGAGLVAWASLALIIIELGGGI